MVVSESQQFASRAGFIVLLGFAIIRPLSLMAHNVSLAGFGVLEFVGVGISYFLLIPFFLSMRKYQANLIDFLILLFCLYAAASVIWGSEIRKVAQTIIPFLLYFSIRIFIRDTRQLNSLLFALVIGFLVPIAVSTIFVMLGISIEMVEFWNKLPRHSGAFSGSHVLAYIMLFFSFFYCLAQRTPQSEKPHFRLVFSIFLLLSIYCLYQSHTRTALIGFAFFWFIFLWGNNKRFFLVSLVLAIFVGFIYLDNINSLLWKTEDRDFKRATSGRTEFWMDNIELFSASSLPQQMIGRGLGHDHLFMFHNDYIGLLMNLGVIGLFLYLFMLITILWDIYFFKDIKIKFLFGGILLSSAIMSFGSNAVISRVELAQYFWLLMGLFYCIPQIINDEYNKDKNSHRL